MNGLFEFVIFSHEDKNEIQKYGDHKFVEEVLKYRNVATELLRGVLLNSRPRVLLRRGREIYSKELLQTISYVTKEEWGRDGSVAPSVLGELSKIIQVPGVLSDVADNFAKNREKTILVAIEPHEIVDKATEFLREFQSECGADELFIGDIFSALHKIRIKTLELYACLRAVYQYPKEVFDTSIFGYIRFTVSSIKRDLNKLSNFLYNSGHTDLGDFHLMVDNFNTLIEPFDKMIFRTQHNICSFVYKGGYMSWCNLVSDVCDYEHHLRIMV